MINQYKKIFKNKKILITGHTGFKGAWLTQFFLLFGSKIMGISNGIISNPNIFKILKLSKKIYDKRCDVRDFQKLKRNILTFKPDFIFHLAAQSLVKYSHKYPKLTFETNINGTLNVLEIAKDLKSLKGIILVTSDKCYDVNRGSSFFNETDPLGGNDPYSSSKAASELLLRPYFNIFLKKKIPISSARAGNVIGGGDWGEDRLVPDIMRSVKNKKILKVRNPNHVRPWQHVFDCLNGYILLMTKQLRNPKKYSGSYNIGPNNLSKIKVKNLVKIFSNNFNFRYKYIKKNTLGETKTLRLNTAKSKKKLNFNCKLNFKNSVDYTIFWYKNFINKKNMYLVSENQIINFYKK
tara:strand:+ start:549 stop:1601 length:1053 start_codon:yes stop_codon:yes gene_type:complete